MSEKVRIGAVGIGNRLISLLEETLQSQGDQFTLAAAYDPAEGIARKAVARLKSEAEVVDSLESLVNHEAVDWVWIGSVNALHAEHCIAAFRAGKDVFCEKPLATEIEDCLRILDVQKETGRKLCTGFVLRYAKLYREMERRIRSGYLGRPISYDGTELLAPDHGAYIMQNWRRHRAQAGPQILEKCCHDIDVYTWLVGALPTRVLGSHARSIFIPENRDDVMRHAQVSDKPPFLKSWPAWEDLDPFQSDKDVEDNGVYIIEHANGVRGTFHFNSCSAVPTRKFRIVGLEGSMEGDLLSGRLVCSRIGRNQEPEELFPGTRGPHGGADVEMLKDVCKAFKEGAEPPTRGEIGLFSAAACLAMDESARTGQPVDLSPTWKGFEQIAAIAAGI